MRIEDPAEGSLDAFDAFVETVGARVRRALVAAYGPEVGAEVAADALVVAWERRSSVLAMENPAGYLYRVGQSRARRHRRWARDVVFPGQVAAGLVSVEVLDLFDALRMLSLEQRVAVVLVKSYGFSYREVADVLGCSVEAVTNHVHRGLQRLRERLEIE